MQDTSRRPETTPASASQSFVKAVASHLSRGPLHAKGIPGVAQDGQRSELGGHGGSSERGSEFPWRAVNRQPDVAAVGEASTVCHAPAPQARATVPIARAAARRVGCPSPCISREARLARRGTPHAAGRCAIRRDANNKKPRDIQRGSALDPRFRGDDGGRSYSPATVMRPTRIEPVRTCDRLSTSVPTASMASNIFLRLPAMVIPSTGNSILPFSTQNPAAPRE